MRDSASVIPTVDIFSASLDLIELLSLHNGVRTCDRLPPSPLEVEPARVLLRVPVGPAERRPAPALEPQAAPTFFPHADSPGSRAPDGASPPATHPSPAPPRLTRERDASDGRIRHDDRRRRGLERFLDGDLRRRGLLLLHAEVAVAFGA
ncbi:uncharacterized protein A4U43_C02F8330 [Asparagus officinalis]|uniref:Uncharacterized protein n=1 Tax=Asparagus officinalis TaxID=4686 RepID=A0A5P1FJM6_ASPOF|nr:uncharacterized protein A4U43_C02F8330 [Asparagus officinalis]